MYGASTYLFRVATFNDHIALVELQAHNTIHSSLTGWDAARDKFTLRAEEEAVVENLTELDGDERIPKTADVAIERQALEVHVGHTENARCRRLVASTRLDTNESVLNDIDAPDTVFPGQRIQSHEHVNCISDSGRATGDFNGKSAFELDRDPFGNVRRRFG